jgi:hypothetical protein
MSDYEFEDEHDKHTADIRVRNMKLELAGVNPTASLLDDHRALAALSCWVFKSNHAPESNWESSPAPGSFYGPEDVLPSGATLPRPPNGPSGFDGVAFYRPQARELVLVSRGSETLRDWVNNLKTLIVKYTGASEDALNFAASAVLALRAAGEPIDRVICTGQSLGAGMANVQAALLNPALNAKTQGPVEVTAVGFASAGFRIPVEVLEKTIGPRDDKAIAGSFHYVRPNDPIRDTWDGLLNYGWPLGQVFDIDANIYNPIRENYFDSGKQKTSFRLSGFPIAHSAYLYFYLWNASPSGHFVNTMSRRLAAFGGREPMKKRFDNVLPQWYR